MISRIFHTIIAQSLGYLFVLVSISIWQLQAHAATDWPSLRPLAPDYVLSLKSQNSNTPTTIKFINRSDDPVDICWVNFKGRLESYGHLAADQSSVIQTYVSHPWIIYDERTLSYIGGFLPRPTAADAIINRPALRSFGANTNPDVGPYSSAGKSQSKIAGTHAAAATFDCSKAVSPTEKRICADPRLAKFDQEMGSLYKKMIRNGKDLKAWQADQRSWLAKRDRCKDDDSCLRRDYQERLLILGATAANQWPGKWTRVDPSGNYPAELVITNATAHSFDFSLRAEAGANNGELEGKAVIDNSKKARGHSTDQDVQDCSLEFERVLNRLYISGRTDEVSCGAGSGVDFSGTYVGGGNPLKAKPDLLALGIAKTAAQDDELRKLLGRDYDYMAQTAQSIIDADDNLDCNRATVVRTFVRGDGCDMKSVLMGDDEGNLWAAVWQVSSSNGNIVELRYYTNVNTDKNTLPKTVSAQRDACPGQTVRVRMMP